MMGSRRSGGKVLRVFLSLIKFGMIFCYELLQMKWLLNDYFFTQCINKGATYGKPKNHGVNQLKPVRNHQAIAEERVGRRVAKSLRVLGSYWVTQDATYKYFEVNIIKNRFLHFLITRHLKKSDWITINSQD